MKLFLEMSTRYIKIDIISSLGMVVRDPCLLVETSVTIDET